MNNTELNALQSTAYDFLKMQKLSKWISDINQIKHSLFDSTKENPDNILSIEAYHEQAYLLDSICEKIAKFAEIKQSN